MQWWVSISAEFRICVFPHHSSRPGPFGHPISVFSHSQFPCSHGARPEPESEFVSPESLWRMDLSNGVLIPSGLVPHMSNVSFWAIEGLHMKSQSRPFTVAKRSLKDRARTVSLSNGKDWTDCPKTTKMDFSEGRLLGVWTERIHIIAQWLNATLTDKVNRGLCFLAG